MDDDNLTVLATVVVHGCSGGGGSIVLVLVALVVGDALVNALEERLCKLRDLGRALHSVILVEVLVHDPAALCRGCSDKAAWLRHVALLLA